MTRTGFFVKASNRMSLLTRMLAADLRQDPPPPLKEEIVIVQSQGMRRWVTLELASHLGVAASLALPFPGDFCHQLATAVARPKQVALPLSNYSRTVLTFRIMAILGAIRTDGRFRGVDGYLKGGAAAKRYQLSARLANLFSDYMTYRPALLLEWERGAMGRAEDGSDWQAELWRRLTTGVEEEHLAFRFLRLTEELEGARSAPAGLPHRLAVFGVNSLPPVFLNLLGALSGFLPVTCYLFDCGYPALSCDEPSHRLAAGLGLQGREFAGMLGAVKGVVSYERYPQLPPRESLLHHLQADILEDLDRRASPSGSEEKRALPVRVAEGDSSLLIHVCHSPLREMEVLRDHLCDAFKQDSDLPPGAVLVMVPDISLYSPYIQAVFGVDHEGLPKIPYRIADCSGGGESLESAAVLQLLRLVDGRHTSAEILDLLLHPSVRRASGLSPDDLPQLHRWVRALSVSWGESAEARAEHFDLPLFTSGSWREGIDRLLMGYATGETESLVAGILPEGGASSRSALIGIFSCWLDRLFARFSSLREARTLAAWGEGLRAMIDELFAPEGTEEEGVRYVRDVLLTLEAVDPLSGLDESVTRAEIIEHLSAAFSEENFGRGFISGVITFCALKPMRTIPFSLIAVCGLSHGEFPRSATPATFDLQARYPVAGDRVLRTDDRQLFLETLLAAGERLHLSYVGRNGRDNSELAPSICLAELMDALRAGFLRSEESMGQDILSTVVVNHPLQPFSERYYNGSEPRLYSYSRENCRASTVVAGTVARAEAEPFLSASLPVEEKVTTLDLYDLTACWLTPCHFFCDRTLGLRIPGAEDALCEEEPVELDGSTRYAIRNFLAKRRLLTGRSDPEEEAQLLFARGSLPPAGVGRAVFLPLEQEVSGFLSLLGNFSLTADLPLLLSGSDYLLTGLIDGMTEEGYRIQYRPATLRAKDRLRAWITHVALNALAEAEGGEWPRTSRLVGLDGEEWLAPVDRPLWYLGRMVEGLRITLRGPLPFFPETSYAYADYAFRRVGNERLKGDPVDAARKAWQGSSFSKIPCEAEERYTALCFRGREPLEDELPAFCEWASAIWGGYFECRKTQRSERP